MAMKAFLAAAVSVGVLAAALAGTARASGPPTFGSGAFIEPSSTLVSYEQRGGVQFIALANVVDWSGTINGEAQETLYITVQPSGDSVFHGKDVFPDGTTISLVGQDSGGAFQGTFTMTGPTGSNGHGTYQGLDDCGGGEVCGTYAGSFTH